MRQRHPFENRYCNPCQCTTRHEVKEASCSCLRCGVVKYPQRATAARHAQGAVHENVAIAS